jgi:trimeric autotransporter adhesin
MKTITSITYPVFALFAFACFALLPMAQALLPPPPPDGGYPGRNTAEGASALLNNTTGTDNTANGFQALFGNMIGISNTGVGARALQHNGSGPNNTAVGADALNGNTFGALNTAVGVSALFANIGGIANTAVGGGALVTLRGRPLLEANENTAVGANALGGATIGSQNTAVGRSALGSVTTGDGNIALGIAAGRGITVGNHNIDIGSSGFASDSATIRIGQQGLHTHTFVAGISGSPIAGTSVVVNNNGRLGTAVSSRRFKDAIKPMDKASEAILALKPVTFRYKKEIDTQRTPQFGLVAEDVEKVDPNLVIRDREGKPYTVRYEAVNAMLLNEFLKEHRRVEDLKHDFHATVAQQQKEIAALTAMVKQQAAQIQKVSAQLQLNKTAPQTVLNNQ